MTLEGIVLAFGVVACVLIVVGVVYVVWAGDRQCDHPFSALGVELQQTVEQEDRDFEIVTYHLCCRHCGASSLQLKHARMIGGVDGFLNRAKP